MKQRSPATSRRYGPQEPSRQTVDRQEWRNWSAVRARLPNLPPGTTTYDIHKNLRRFGELEFIRIEETRQGNFGKFATVNFKPPPIQRAPWDPHYRDGVEFTLRAEGSGRKHLVKVQLAQNQPMMQLVDSPVRAGLRYPREVTLPARSIDFGYLQNPSTMMIKATRKGQGIRLALNLKRLEMEIHFPVMIRSKGKTTERAYRFYVALDDQFSLCEVHENGETALVVHVKNAPWYSRQLKEAMQISHDDDSHRWSADDTWSRQTDIVEEKETYQKIDQSPVSTQKLDNCINIASWTTFRLTVAAGPELPNELLGQFLQALTDFNIRVSKNATFNVIRAPIYHAPIWDLLNESHARSLSEQLTMPHLDYELRYQLEVCISKGWLNEYSLDSSFLQHLAKMPSRRAKQMLVHVDTHEQRIYDPMSIFTDVRFTKPVRASPLPAVCAEIHHATITATGIIFNTPSIEVSNRIVRKYLPYSDRFLRVRFEDDSYRGQTRLYPTTNGKMKLIFERVRRTLRNGILMGDRHYEFLAWGNSQLREHGVYFFASSQSPRITADDIRRDMGTFDREHVVAKRAARMGQCFSTTWAVSVLGRNSWRRDPIRDIKNDDYCFTDGVGKISSLAAQMVKIGLKFKTEDPTPSAYQFRLGGCKGVLAVDPTLTSASIQIRDSQYKFQCESDELEIIRWSAFMEACLNRQLILVLSSLGVPDQIFLHKQDHCIQHMNAALVDDDKALEALRISVDPNQSTLTIAAMIEAGFSLKNEPFVASLMLLWRAWRLKYLKEKAKIGIEMGALVLGVADETGTLRGHINDIQPGPGAGQEELESALPEIFIQYSDQHHKGQRHIVEGICIIARNPSLHRGDVRVVKAVNVPQLRHHCDVVVMPTQGDRDLPSMCSGGDLDGDDFIVIWDPELIPQEWNAEPFHYNAPNPVKKDKISTEDIINFFYDYMQNDFLGRIATAHLASADFLDEGLNGEQCLKLVELHSMAVDYPKTGVPAQMTRDLERDHWPHFMEKKRARMYHSNKILGRLYDAVDRVQFQPYWQGTFDPRILAHPPAEALIETVSKLKKSYDESLQRIMAQHQIKSEFEVWSTFVLDHSKAAPDYKFHEEIGQHAKSLKAQYYEAFCQEADTAVVSRTNAISEQLFPFAITAYHITHNELRAALQQQEELARTNRPTCLSEDSEAPAEVEMPFISFPWVLQDSLQTIARRTTLHEEPDQSGSMVPLTGKFTWTGNEQHLPDPYTPVASIPEADQTAAVDVPDQKSLPTLAIDCKPSIGIDHSSTDSSARASTELSSTGSSGESVSPSLDEPGIPLSSLARSSDTSAPSSRASGVGPQDHAQVPTLLASSKVTQDQGNTTEFTPFKDPGLMTEDELRALTGIREDDEDDFTF